jgi:hypothetical protein
LTPPAWQANIREEIFVSERKLKKKKNYVTPHIWKSYSQVGA